MKIVMIWFILRNYIFIIVYKMYNCILVDYMCYMKFINGRILIYNGGFGGLKKVVWVYLIEMLWFWGLFLVGKIIV